MKLRARGDSIRLRLTQSEVKEIREGRFVQETINFVGGNQLHYALEPSPLVSTLQARFNDQCITVLVPTHMALDWASSDKIEMKTTGEPFILVEKDFVCLKSRENESEDESDMFPNPNQAHGKCGGSHG
jgi:hypothetical protein